MGVVYKAEDSERALRRVEIPSRRSLQRPGAARAFPSRGSCRLRPQPSRHPSRFPVLPRSRGWQRRRAAGNGGVHVARTSGSSCGYLGVRLRAVRNADAQDGFRGETVTDTLAEVIKEEPDWLQLPAATPIRVWVFLQRCLQKDPKQRLQAIGDARISLEELLAAGPEPSAVAATLVSTPFWRQSNDGQWAEEVIPLSHSSSARLLFP
jgi:hypothetical protein